MLSLLATENIVPIHLRCERYLPCSPGIAYIKNERSQLPNCIMPISYRRKWSVLEYPQITQNEILDAKPGAIHEEKARIPRDKELTTFNYIGSAATRIDLKRATSIMNTGEM